MPTSLVSMCCVDTMFAILPLGLLVDALPTTKLLFANYYDVDLTDSSILNI